MRIDRLEIQNFKKFTKQNFDLHPQFTLLVGDNGAGKTSVLDALAVAIGLWQKGAPGSGWRNILTEEIRIDPVPAGDRVFFEPRLPTTISVVGSIGSSDKMTWTRMIREGGTRTTNAGARDAEAAISSLVKQPHELLPVLAYYGAGRAWLPSNKRPSGPTVQRKPQRFDAYRNCLDTRIRDRDLNEWFLFEAAAANGQESGRPGLRAVAQAILDCVPEADSVRYDSNLKEVVLSIHGFEQPFYNLSAGQRMMLALVADLAIKAVTLNSHLLGPGMPGADDPALVLKRSPGIALIDELDVHLHPKWQRRVATDLKCTFPGIQFVCTSHSPQIIGELSPQEIRVLEEGLVSIPPRSFGIDSSRVLEEVMGSIRQDKSIGELLRKLFELIDRDDLDSAREVLRQVEARLGADDPETTRARTLMAFLEDTQ